MVFFVVEDKQVIEETDLCANVNIVVEWVESILAEGTVVWNDYENNIVKIIKDLLTALSHQYALFYQC